MSDIENRRCAHCRKGIWRLIGERQTRWVHPARERGGCKQHLAELDAEGGAQYEELIIQTTALIDGEELPVTMSMGEYRTDHHDQETT